MATRFALLAREDVILELWHFRQTGRRPWARLFPPQRRFLMLATTYLDRHGWQTIDDRTLLILRLQTLKSSPPLALLPEGMAFRLQALGLDPVAEAEERRRRMIEDVQGRLGEG